MSGLSVKLPLVVSNVFGPYELNTTFNELAKQNLKMLVLTNPGERIMHPDFGVGISRFLFENNTSDTYGEIRSRIHEQVNIYLSYIQIDHVDFSAPEDNPDLFPNSIRVNIFFTIVPLKQSTSLQININN
ncbi:MAG TPA: hypothetical protein EYN67_13865 [Flavobacteriales bacterium]|nr:hypothetical protein [Flavobacteriales bacterium]